MHTLPCRLLLLGFLAGAAPTFTAAAAETSFSLEDGLEIEWDDDRYLSMGGRIHYDVARYDDDVTVLEDEQDFRRARAILRARYDDWQFRADYDVGIVEGWRNLYVRYRGWSRKRLTIGNQVAPFSLDELTSSNDLAMMERSLASALSPAMLTGISLRTWGDDWSATAGVFGNELSDLDRRTVDGTSVIGRVTWAPIRKKRRVLHLGLAQEYRSVDSNEDVRIRARPESRLTDERLVNTDRLAGVDALWTTGVEFMGILDNVRLQSEFMRMGLRGGPNEADFTGGYVQAGWVVTGERYRYSRSRGVPTSVRPKGDWGALELSARYSTLDLEDGPVTGGEQSQITAAVSLYLNEQLRVSVNYSRYDAAPNLDGIDEDGSILMFRFQAAL
ncbi:MAG TPA: porin [Woeseiaceae bacterium]|nr:porin [Woeseiaceae bacterium]